MSSVASIHMIFFLLLMIQQQTLAYSESGNSECRVYNEKFRAYIEPTFKFLGLGSERGVRSYRPSEYQKDYNNGLDIKTEYVESDLGSIWIFEPVPGRQNTFYLRNKKYTDEYLRTSIDYQEWWWLFLFKHHRPVLMSGLDQVDDEFYMWRFDPISYIDRYLISNIKLGTRMYSKNFRGSIQKLMTIEINTTIDYRFEWILKCKYDLVPPVKRGKCVCL